jgi:hypothetical protein
VRVIEHIDLFGRIAHRARIVDHQRLALKAFEQVGGGDIAKVKRRVLPHEHDIDIAPEIDLAHLAHRVVRALDPLDGDRRGLCAQAARFPGQRGHMVIPQLRPARRAESISAKLESPAILIE